MRALVSSQWGTALVVIARAIALAAAGVAWWLLLTPARRGPYIFAGLRFVREAINSLFPFVGIGTLISVYGLKMFGNAGLPCE